MDERADTQSKARKQCNGMSETKAGRDWKTNDSFKTCSYCGNTVKHGMGWTTVGLCDEHERILSEDIKSGWERNRLREIMVERGEVTFNEILVKVKL
jgi:hypothetical protein